MASPFGVRFFTRGYERTSREMSSIEKKAKWISTGFVRMGKASAGVGPKIARGLGILRGGLTTTFGAMKMFLGLVLRVTVALGAVGTVVAGVGAALITKFAKGLMTTRENFYLIETALTGVIKNAAQVRKISDWAMKYAAEFPAMYSDVMDAMKGLAMMPSLKPMFTKASVVDMEKIMNIVQGLAALDPQQGVKGALLAMREALAGQWRTLQYRFEIRPQAIASAAGLSMDELKNMPEKAIEALDAFIRLNVGADTLRKSAESLGVQWGNLSDQYEMWLNTVAQYGAYRKLVKFLMEMNDVWAKILKGDAARRFGQDISRVFEAMIEGAQSAITGIDWEKAGIFGGLLEAGKNIIDKISALFVDAKDVFASSMQVVLIYMKKVLIFSVKNIFWPVGVEIADAIVKGFSDAIDAKKDRMRQELKEVFVDPVKKLGTGTRLKEMTSQFKDILWDPLKEFFTGEPVKKMEKEAEKGVLPEVAKEKKIGIFDEESDTAIKKLKTDIESLAKKWEAALDPRKELVLTTPAEEQVKKVVEARSNLRLAEVTGTKALVETLKSQLRYEERLLGYHRKAGEWALDPRRGKREEQLKIETKTLRTSIAKDIGEGKAEEQIRERESNLAKKEAELKELLEQKEKALGDVKRYTGPELEKKALAAIEKQNDIKAKLLSTEEQIAKLKREGGEDVSVLVDLEDKLLKLSKQKITVEQQYTNAKRQQIDIQNRIQTMEMQRGRPGEIGLSALDQAKSQFQTFQQWIKKSAVKRRFGREEMPGMGGMTWRRGVEKSVRYRTKGIPRFFLKQEEVLKEKLEKPDISVVAQKTVLERLYRVNVDQFQMARGITAKGAQFQEANKFMKQLQDIDTQLQEEQIALAKEQAGNIARMVIEVQTTNKWLSGISSKTGVVPAAQSQPATLSSQGNQKITEANPVTAPAGIM